ncbi:AraC family transcriptional regulator [Actinomadura sp. WAC 06369]|uniref:AraC family transcriptional regulator n=1 Tax=Actinomadura sp. WAC 06369 TaxID=2203193 RepID=UPI000F7A61AB|nr:AraC family transcriptional regulator [Actinomadura sp. WAC 06369]RSN68572.1 AraC family transcriptional regulator [Actinomadura sp. WAC 06369]
MFETVFRTADAARADRIGRGREPAGRSPVPGEPGGGRDRPGTGGRALRLGTGPDAVTVLATATSPAGARRTPRRVRRPDPGALYLSLVLRGHVEVACGGRVFRYGPAQWSAHDASRPATVRAAGGPGPFEAVGVVVPKRLLSVPADRLGRAIGPPLPGRDGVGGLLAGTLAAILADPGAYRASDGPRLATVLADLASALLAHAVDADEEEHGEHGEDDGEGGGASPEVRRRTLLLRAHAFIDRHLQDPELTPAAVAAAHHISVSYLHRLFSAEGRTVAAWIRLRRLEGARLALADPALRAVPVHRIAAMWGFTHHSAFSRAFRDAFGLPPSDYRHRALGSPA